jgi:16S rRNA (guanine527-N7)-methyltransferase
VGSAAIPEGALGDGSSAAAGDGGSAGGARAAGGGGSAGGAASAGSATPAGTTRPALVPSLEDEPAIAELLFGDRIDLARAYTADLARRGEELGLIGPRELSQLWSRHIINSALVAPLLTSGTIGDVGSGAGLPGIVLAIARPDVNLVLIEPMERRVEWLIHESRELGLTNVRVLRARAEDAKLEWPLDQVTARAVTALDKLIPATARLVKAGGEMIFMKGARVHDEVTAAAKAIRKARLTNVEVLTLGEGIVPEVTRVFRATVD